VFSKNRLAYVTLIVSIVSIVIIAIIAVISTTRLANSHNANYYSQLNQLSSLNASIVYNSISYNTTFYAAETVQQQEQGYMNVSQPSSTCFKDCGMVFTFSGYMQTCFWMKNTEFPIKQLWLREISPGIYNITAIVNATPYNTTPICNTGNDVLELPSNEIIDGLLNVSMINRNYVIRIS
jgi:uncharacterized membrane protein (UPF0127 family)